MIRLGLLPFHALLLLAMLLSGCATRPPMLDGFTIGFSSHDDNLIWILDAEFDGTWTVPGGSIGCCWQEAGGMTGIGPGPMPSSVRVRWDDESRGVTYEAQTELPEDLTAQAIELPPITRKANGEQYYDPMLIIGLQDNGDMVIWLSNASHGVNLRGRVLEIVAQAEGRVVRKMPPEERSSNGD